MKLMNLILGLVLLMLTQLASAGLLVEPQLGYVLSNSFKGSAKFNSVDSNIDTSGSGVLFGGRLGGQFLGVMAGLNYDHMTGTSECKSCSPAEDQDISSTNLGVFVGYNAPILVRAWLAYNFSSKLTFENDTNSVDKGDYYKGKSTQIGVGFTGLPIVSLNFIYTMYDYDEGKIAGTTYSMSGLEPKEYALSISAPFNFF